MIVFLQCVAEAAVQLGLRGLAEMVPGGGYAYLVAESALEKYRARAATGDQADMAAIARAGTAEVAAAAAGVARATAGGLPEADRMRLELYLSQIPATVRRTLRRPSDPGGTTVPAGFTLSSPDDVLALLPPTSPRHRPGDSLTGKPDWVLERLLGTGGFGEVWLARHARLASLAGAVKFCRGRAAADLRHEARLIDRVMAAGSHPNVVGLVDACLDGEAPWLMYEYVAGGDLADLIGDWGDLQPAARWTAAIRAFRDLVAAVAHFHGLIPPIVHRDLKPANVLRDAPAGRLRVTDFGIGGVAARAAGVDGPTTLAGRLPTGLRSSHTPVYASPQQQDGAAPDPRDDVYALGVIGYQMFTGQIGAGPGPDFAAELWEHAVPDTLSAILGRCMAVRPERRPADAAALLAELDGMVGGTPQGPRTAASGPHPVGIPGQGAGPAAPTSSGGPGTRPFPQIKMRAFRELVRSRRRAAGHPDDGRDVVYVFRATPVGGASYHPLFALPGDVVRELLAGSYRPEDSRLFIHLDGGSGPRYEELAPEAVVDPTTSTAPVNAPRARDVRQ